VINNLVHNNRIKPYFYRDELPDNPDDISGEVIEHVGNAPVWGEAIQTAPEVVRPDQTKAVKKFPGRLELVTASGPIINLVEVMDRDGNNWYRIAICDAK